MLMKTRSVFLHFKTAVVAWTIDQSMRWFLLPVKYKHTIKLGHRLLTVLFIDISKFGLCVHALEL